MELIARKNGAHSLIEKNEGGEPEKMKFTHLQEKMEELSSKKWSSLARRINEGGELEKMEFTRSLDKWRR